MRNRRVILKIPFFLFSSILLILLLFMIPAYGHIDIFPGFEGEEIVTVEGEFHIPSSLLSSRDSYGLLVRNERDQDTVEIQVIIPVGFELLSVREEEGWEFFLLPDNSGNDRIIIWNGSTVESGEEETFLFTLQNPPAVLVYFFIVVQIYENGDNEVWRPWVQVIPSNNIGGVEFVTLGVGAVSVALALPLVESILVKVRK